MTQHILSRLGFARTKAHRNINTHVCLKTTAIGSNMQCTVTSGGVNQYTEFFARLTSKTAAIARDIQLLRVEGR